MFRAIMLLLTATYLSIKQASAAGTSTKPPGFHDIRTCKGVEKEAGPCEDLPSCDQCTPINCLWRPWSGWAPVGGCTGLEMRSRVIEQSNNECGKPCDGPKMTTQKIAQDPSCVHDPENCVFGDWTEWVLSDTTMQYTRTREIVTPPVYGGEECEGATKEVKPPPPSNPPVPCTFTEWGEWTQCSVPCGGGVRAHFRRIFHHAKNNGATCEGATQHIEPCNTQLCDKVRNCSMSEWSDWSCCDHGYQQKYRTRKVKPTHIPNAFRLCDEEPVKQTAPCPVAEGDPCKVNPWSQWSDCPATCDGGQQFRARELADPGNVKCESRPLKETRGCGEVPCKGGDCLFGDWNEWATCSVSCGVGVKERKREIASFASDTGHGCNGNTKEAAPCDMKPCDRTNCKWSLWDDWSACSARCGGGTKRRDRSVQVAPRLGGKLCDVQAASEVMMCNMEKCGHCINGSWMQWSGWEPCSATCGEGFTSRHREVAVHPNNCGTPIEGYQDEYKKCESGNPCIPTVDCKIGAWTEWGGCSASCYGVQERTRVVETFAQGAGKSCRTTSLKDIQQCNSATEPGQCSNDTPPPCVVGAWSSWGECSATCDGGQATRERQIATPAAIGGKPCADVMQETKGCATVPCNQKPAVDCKWAAWSDWGGCSRCGGQRFRVRQITQSAANGGKICENMSTKETDVCKSNCQHDMYCAWSEWSKAGACSAECGPSTKIRQRALRQVLKPPDDSEFLFKGLPSMACGGSQIEVIPCPTTPCNTCDEVVDGAFSEWSVWSHPTCTQLCERHRVVAVQAKCGGTVPTGALVSTKVCHYNCTVPKDCEWGLWGDWSGGSNGRGECSDADTGTQRYRMRSILAEAENGGIPCKGALNETDSCAPPPKEPVNCELEPWAAWEECSASCGKGFKKRERSIKVAALNGGEGCVGVLKEQATCDTFDVKCHCDLDVCPLWANCEVGDWSDWATDPTDPTGYQCFSSREVIREAVENGTACNGTLKLVKSCRTVVDCEVTEWSEWDKCDKPCGSGQQVRHRAIHTHPEQGGKPCPHELIVTQGCNMEPCEVPECKFTPWAEWATCTATCGGALTKRSRSFDNAENCEGNMEEVKPCGTEECPSTNCKWSDWTLWSSCTCLCGGGQKTRDRNIATVPTLGGDPCLVQDREEVVPCNTQPCGNQNCVDGVWADWDDWQVCSLTCEGGYTWRSREVAQEANDCGTPVHGMSRETAKCNSDVPCNPKQDCEMGDWGAWSGCSCDCYGEKNRARSIMKHARFGGERCTGALKEVWPCNPGEGEHPPKDCQKIIEPCKFTDWSSWTPCSATCDGGITERKRDVSEPKDGGRACTGNLAEVESCNTQECKPDCTPTDCLWGDWKQWGDCDKCGGQKRRFRHVVVHAKCGGAACQADAAEETAACPRKCHDLMYCTWGTWSAWGTCDTTCGVGTRFRERMLSISSATQAGVSEEDARFLVNKMGLSSLDEQQMEDKLMELKMQTRSYQTERFQEVVVAFAAGGISLVVFALTFRMCTKESENLPQRYSSDAHMPLAQAEVSVE